MSNNSVTDFSAQCTPQLTEENLQLSFAMYKFVKDNGGKNKLNILHEKLQAYDQKVSQLLAKQEELVQNVSKNCVCEELAAGGENELQDSNKKTEQRISHLDLYSRIMNATIQVKKELEELRQYSEKVVQLENERNALVDYVFSLPPEQRLSGLNFIENIKRTQPEECNATTSTPCVKNTENINQSDINQKFLGYQLTEVLSTMENEAVSLVSLNEEQRHAYIDELEKLRSENLKLTELLQIAAETNDTCKILDLEQKCNRIEHDLHEVRKGLEAEVTAKDVEIARLTRELEAATEQSMVLDEQIIDLKSSIDSVVFENEQLHETINEMMAKEEAEKDDEVEEIINLQQEQIKNLMMIICNLNDPCEVKDENKDMFEEDVFDSGLASSKTFTDAERSQSIIPQEKEEKSSQNEEQQTFTPKTLNPRPPSCQSYSLPQISCKDKGKKQIRVKKLTSAIAETVTTTSLNVESCDMNGRKETMRAVLESSNVMDGVLEMENSSKLKLRLRCTSPRCRSPINSSQRDTAMLRGTSQGGTHLSNIDKDTADNSHSIVTLHNKPNYNFMKEDISQQLNTIKKEMDLSLKQPNRKANVINNIKSIYSRVFGVKEEEAV